MPRDVPDRVCRENARLVTETVVFEVCRCHFLQASDSVLAVVFDTVESSLEFPAAIVLRLFCHRLRRRFRRFANAPPGEQELVPPNVAAFEQAHLMPPSFPDVTLVACSLQQSQLEVGLTGRAARAKLGSHFLSRLVCSGTTEAGHFAYCVFGMSRVSRHVPSRATGDQHSLPSRTAARIQ